MSGSVACLLSMATRGLLTALAASYETPVALTAVGGVDAARRIRGGEATDVVVLASGPMAALASEGHLLPESLVPIVVSGIAVAVPTGATPRSIDDEAALREAVLVAPRIGYSTGPSGDHLRRMLQGWGILPQVEPRLIQARPGVPVASLLAEGKADLGFQQLSELSGQPGITVLGPLPPAVQSLTTFTAGISRLSAQQEAAAAFIQYLAAPDAEAVKRQYGLDPI